MSLKNKDNKYLTYLKNRCRAIEDERETAVNQARERKEQNIHLKAETATQQRLYEELLTNKAKLQERLREDSSLGSRPVTQLIERRSAISSLDQEKTKKIKKVYNAVIVAFVSMAEDRLRMITDASNQELITSPEDHHKQQYKIYGLLLSACRFRKRSSSDGVDQQTSQQVLIAVAKHHTILHDNEPSLKSNMEKAVALTHSMLTRLPPLLVCKTLLYHEDYYDTNRLTWDETKKTSTCTFLCYRPVVFFGNTKHVAVKGLLGNTEEEIKDDVLPLESCELEAKTSLLQDKSQPLKEKPKLASSLRTDSIISNSDFQVPTGPITNSSNQETPRISVYATKGVDTLSKNPWSSIKQRKQLFEQPACRAEPKPSTVKTTFSKSRSHIVKEKCLVFENEHSSKMGLSKEGAKKPDIKNATPMDSSFAKQRCPRSSLSNREKKLTTV